MTLWSFLLALNFYSLVPRSLWWGERKRRKIEWKIEETTYREWKLAFLILLLLPRKTTRPPFFGGVTSPDVLSTKVIQWVSQSEFVWGPVEKFGSGIESSWCIHRSICLPVCLRWPPSLLSSLFIIVVSFPFSSLSGSCVAAASSSPHDWKAVE